MSRIQHKFNKMSNSIFIVGKVNPNGTSAGDGFSSALESNGIYRVTFSETLSSSPTVLATPDAPAPDENGRGAITLRRITPNSFEVVMNDMNANYIDYLGFNFIVVV